MRHQRGNLGRGKNHVETAASAVRPGRSPAAPTQDYPRKKRDAAVSPRPLFQEDRTLKLAQAPSSRHPPPEPESRLEATSEHSPVEHSPALADKPQLELL